MSQPLQHAYGYQQFAWRLATICFVFIIVAALIAAMLDAACMSIAVILDSLGWPNYLAQSVRESVFLGWIGVGGAYLVHLLHQGVSAIFAIVSFVVAGRVVLWWMVVTAPLEIYLSGFSLSADFYLDRVPVTALIVWPIFFLLLGTQLIVLTSCWLLTRHVRLSPTFGVS
jgi:hypothetical protein